MDSIPSNRPSFPMEIKDFRYKKSKFMGGKSPLETKDNTPYISYGNNIYLYYYGTNINMDRRKFLKLGILASSALYVGTYRKEILRKLIEVGLEDGKYDFDEILIDDYDGLNEGAIEYTRKTNPKAFEGHGIGFKKGDYLWTANHIVDGNWDVFIEDEQMEIVKKDKENDLAVFKLPTGYEGKEFPLGDSDELKEGNLVVVGGKGNSVKANKHTKIASATGVDWGILSKEVGKENAFMLWASIVPGDSGGPVYAFRDGEPEIVGMNKSYIYGFGEAHKINHIKEALT